MRPARALWLREPGQAEIRSVDLARPGADEVLVRTLYSGVSRGTESVVFRGGVPDSQRETMRAPFQEGDFPGPVKPVLASAVDGVPQALGRAPGGDLPGGLVPPGDPGALATALREWFAEPGQRARLRAAARERRTGLRGWEETTAVLADVLKQAGTASDGRDE